MQLLNICFKFSYLTNHFHKKPFGAGGSREGSGGTEGVCFPRNIFGLFIIFFLMNPFNVPFLNEGTNNIIENHQVNSQAN